MTTRSPIGKDQRRDAAHAAASTAAFVECIAWTGPVGNYDDNGSAVGYAPGFEIDVKLGLVAWVLPWALVQTEGLVADAPGYWSSTIPESQFSSGKQTLDGEAMVQKRMRQLDLIRSKIARVRICGLPPNMSILPSPKEFSVLVFGPYPGQARFGVIYPILDPKGDKFLVPQGVPTADYERARTARVKGTSSPSSSTPNIVAAVRQAQKDVALAEATSPKTVYRGMGIPVPGEAGFHKGLLKAEGIDAWASNDDSPTGSPDFDVGDNTLRQDPKYRTAYDGPTSE